MYFFWRENIYSLLYEGSYLIQNSCHKSRPTCLWGIGYSDCSILMNNDHPFNPINLYGMFYIKVKTTPFWILRVERVNMVFLNSWIYINSIPGNMILRILYRSVFNYFTFVKVTILVVNWLLILFMCTLKCKTTKIMYVYNYKDHHSLYIETCDLLYTCTCMYF